MSTKKQVSRAIDRLKDEQGRSWIWARDADWLYQIPFWNLALWLRRICPWIGKKLHPPQYRPGPSGKPRRYLLESEVEAISNAIVHDRKPVPPPSDPDVLPLAEIEKRLPAAKRGFLLYAHHHPERYGAGRSLWAAKLTAYDAVGKRRRKLWHMRLSEVEKLLKAVPKGPRPIYQPYTDLLGREWYPPSLARQLYGLHKQKLREARIRKHTALGRPIRFLKPKDVPAALRANRQVYYYSADDCRRIGEWLDRTPALERAKAFLRSTMASGLLPYRVIAAKAREENLRPKTLDMARRALGIRSTRVGNRGGITYWHRSYQRLPTAQLVSISHPRLDEALQFLQSIPNVETIPVSELVRWAGQTGIAETTLGRARSVLRCKALAESAATRKVNGQNGPGVPATETNYMPSAASGKPQHRERLPSPPYPVQVANTETNPIPVRLVGRNLPQGWSPANNVKHWARVFGVSTDTMARRLKDGTIRNKRLSNRVYQIGLEELPGEQQP